MTGIVERALSDEDRGLGLLAPELEEDAVLHLVNIANGDARVALNALEMAVVAAEPGKDGVRRIGMEAISDALQRRTPQYDKAGDSHYDTISAFIKSVRGSSPDGALYWLARMLEAGEDPLFIARRLVILAAEDIGLANPGALPVAVAAQQAVHFIGLPEGRIPLAEATVYLATSPKSNAAYVALGRAMQDVRNAPHEPVPLHLRNAATGLMRGMGYGKDYKYGHDSEGPLRGAGVPAARSVRPPLLRAVGPGLGGRHRRTPAPLVGRRREVGRYRITRTRACGGWSHSIPRSVISAFSSTLIGILLPSHSSAG